MDLSPVEVETDLIDLSEISLATLHRCDPSVLSASVRKILAQVDNPRANLGTGPPGRVD
ncbi:hypothetical protein [Actinoplanes utahensis]|uniref:hypothetical protein n=1 Tax=Actinoplanes utahensis TaxID=1869 RepID=UPI001378A03B|nr:hypothetical protein [Actinoplanes utahensis]GIF32092.1 hypothetical protein Aut01nite_50780 [Actinoplanes utahensis]